MANQLTEAEMARAVQRGIRSEQNKRYLAAALFFVALGCSVGMILLVGLVTLNMTALIVAAVIGFILPFALWGKHL